jgi:hypothetical protein
MARECKRKEISFISSQIRLQYAMSVHWSILGSSKRRTIAAHEISSVKYYGRLETTPIPASCTGWAGLLNIGCPKHFLHAYFDQID